MKNLLILTSLLISHTCLAATGAVLSWWPNDTNEKAHLGAEYRLIPEFTLRLGSKLNYDTQGLTAGAGFVVRRLGLDYAFEDMKVAGFDSSHKFSLRVTW